MKTENPAYYLRMSLSLTFEVGIENVALLRHVLTLGVVLNAGDFTIKLAIQ